MLVEWLERRTDRYFTVDSARREVNRAEVALLRTNLPSSGGTGAELLRFVRRLFCESRLEAAKGRLSRLEGRRSAG